MASSFWIKNLAKPLTRIYPGYHAQNGGYFDVAVIGGGVVGCTTAYLLKQAGKKVALIEGRTVGSGATSTSTGELSTLQGSVYSMIVQKHNLAKANQYYEMNQRAIDQVEALIKRLKLDCSFERRSCILWTSEAEQAKVIKKEFDVCRDLEIPCMLKTTQELSKELPHSLKPLLGLEFPNQAQLDPVKFCTELAKHFAALNGDQQRNGWVFEETRVLSVETNPVGHDTHAQMLTLSSCHGDYKLFAKDVVVSTHLPFLKRSAHFTMFEGLRTHCIAVKLPHDQLRTEAQAAASTSIEGKVDAMKSMFLGMDAAHPARSLRDAVHCGPGKQCRENEKVIIVASEGVPIGSERDNAQRCYASLEKWVSEHFCGHAEHAAAGESEREAERVSEMQRKGEMDVLARWSAIDYPSADHIPYVGLMQSGCDSLYTATAFSPWGLTNAFASAEVLCDLIVNKYAPKGQEYVNPYAAMVDARRWDLAAQWRGMVKENLHVAKHLVGDKLSHALQGTAYHALQPNEGGVFHSPSFEKIGVFRDAQGEFHAVKPVCTHLGCDLMFNAADRVWDCPCHGSRFDVDGNVLNGPACKPLLKPKVIVK